MNGQNSHSILKEFFVLELKGLNKASFASFQQNGAPPHFSRDVRRYLDKAFPNRGMMSIRWAPHVLLTCLRWTFFYGNMLRTIFTSHQFAISAN